MSYRRRMAEKAIKANLADQLARSGIDKRDVAEWLWEDFGKKPRPDWKTLKKTIISSPEITPQDIAVFMIEHDIMPEEGAWDVLPRRGLRSDKPNVSGG